MNTSTLFDCTRPILVEAPGAPFPYFLGGAGFIGIYEDVGFFITAAHVVRRLESEDLLILAHECRVGLPLLSRWIPTSGSDGDDVAVFPFMLFSAEEDAPNLREHSVPLTDTIISRGGAALVVGRDLESAACPESARGIDYDARHIAAKTLTLELTYIRPDVQRQFIHQASVQPRADIHSWQGISGSPVFVIAPPTFGFVGMIIEAGGGLCHFVDSSRIYAIIKRVHTEVKAAVA